MNKQLGAKEMFRQSLVYLFNSYREEGCSVQEAKEKVTEHIHGAIKEYDTIINKEVIAFTNPVRLIDEIVLEVKFLEPPSASGKTADLRYQTVRRKLYHLKKVLGG